MPFQQSCGWALLKSKSSTALLFTSMILGPRLFAGHFRSACWGWYWPNPNQPYGQRLVCRIFPEWHKPNKPNQTKPDQTKPNQTKPNQQTKRKSQKSRAPVHRPPAFLNEPGRLLWISCQGLDGTESTQRTGGSKSVASAAQTHGNPLEPVWNP